VRCLKEKALHSNQNLFFLGRSAGRGILGGERETCCGLRALRASLGRSFGQAVEEEGRTVYSGARACGGETRWAREE
jgi:hypothetical protein